MQIANNDMQILVIKARGKIPAQYIFSSHFTSRLVSTMKSAVFIVVFAYAFAFTAVECWFPSHGSGIPEINIPLPEISGDLFSTLRIFARLCLGNVNDTVASNFWDCYNVTGGVEVFETCQTQVFGFLVDSGENVRRLCRTFYKLPMYAGCVVNGFSNTTLDMDTTFDQVNKCEAEVLGIGALNVNSTIFGEDDNAPSSSTSRYYVPG